MAEGTSAVNIILTKLMGTSKLTVSNLPAVNTMNCSYIAQLHQLILPR